MADGPTEAENKAAIKAAMVGAASPQEGEFLFEVEGLDLNEEWARWCAEIGLDLDIRHFT